jgi:hypothetical protein
VPNETKRESRGFLYKLWDSEIFVRNRPRTLSIGERGDKEEVALEDQADAYLSVTDTWCVAPSGKQFAWVPWNESRCPTGEQFYACNKTILWWAYYMKLPKIQIFCDGGTHRSVTVFGAFLMTYFSPGDREEIVRSRIPVNQDLADPKLIEVVCDPLDYVEKYLEMNPSDALLFRAMGKNYMGRLEDYAADIYRDVKERYASNNGSRAD